MRIPLPNRKLNPSLSKRNLSSKIRSSVRYFFILLVSLSITFSNYAQDDDSDFLDKVLEDKTKKTDTKKVANQNQTAPGLKDKKKKGAIGKNGKKTSKTTAKLDPNKRPAKTVVPITSPIEATNSNNPQHLSNNKLNLEFWMHEELTMNPENIPGLEPETVQNNPNPTSPVLANNTTEKPADKKNPDKPIEKDSKPNAFLTFLNDYKKTIFIFAAIIIFAIYRLRYVGPRDYNNSGRIFSKFRNK